jgi:hypothetical protein
LLFKDKTLNKPIKPKTHLFSPHTDQCIYCGKSAQDDAIENTPCGSEQPEACEPTQHNKSLHMQMARTTRETVHGNPGERRVLPANTLIVIIPASNLPPDSRIKYWAHPVEGHPWPSETRAWAEDVGVGLHSDDVAFVKMPAFLVT